MNAFTIVLFVVFVVLTIITLVGHGIWVLLAKLFGAGKPQKRRPCVFCGRMTTYGPDDSRCDWCGRDIRGRLAAELADIEAVQRQLRRFREAGTLRPDTVDNMLARLARYRQGLLAPPEQAPQAAPQPAAAARPVPPVVPTQPLAASQAVQPLTPTQPLAASQPMKMPQVAATTAKPQAAEAPAKPQAAKLPAPPRRSWGEMLAGFMEERNIRWGELIGGLLFVSSSVALVVSLWNQLEKIPYFEFFIFVTVSAAVFGVGLYAHHRWKLASTSRGMLIIATLLVPLNFVAIARAPREDGSWMIALVSELLSLGLFTWLVGLAARVLVAEARWLAVLAVLGNSALVLVIARLIHPESPPALLVGLGAISVALFAAAIGWQIRGFVVPASAGRASIDPAPPAEAGTTEQQPAEAGTTKQPPAEAGTTEQQPAEAGTTKQAASQATALFTLLGITAFSMAVALGLLIAQAVTMPTVTLVLQRLSVLVALAGMPILAAGLTVVRGTPRDAALGAYRLAGTNVALAGMIAMLAALGLAWPVPGWIIAVGVLDAVALVAAAFRWRLPVLHAGAIACAALAYLTAFHLVIGDLVGLDHSPSGVEMLRLTISARSGTALAGLFVVFVAVSEWLARRGYRRHGFIYMGGCAVVAVVGLMLVTVHGLRQTGEMDSLRAAILYGIYGAGSLAMAARWRRIELSYLGLSLLTAAPLWALWWHPATHHVGPLWAAVLAAEALVMAALAAVLRFVVPASAGGRPIAGPAQNRLKAALQNGDIFRVPLAHLAEAAGMLAAALAIATAWFDRGLIDWSPAPIVAAVCLAAGCFLLAGQYCSPWRTWTGSLIVLAGTVHALAFNYHGLVQQPWLVALLSHATVAIIAALVLDNWRKIVGWEEARRSPTNSPPLRPGATTDVVPGGEGILGNSMLSANLGRVFAQPLADSALLSSVLFLPAVAFGPWGSTLWMAGCLFWLAAVWLVLAWRSRDAGLLAAHQVALTAATLVATTAWLQGHGLFAGLLHALADPQALQVYGIALGLLSLAWIAVRQVSRLRLRREIPLAASHDAGGGQNCEAASGKSLRSRERQSGLTVDRFIRHGVVAAQWLVLIACLVPHAIKELIRGSAVPTPLRLQGNAFGAAAWVLLAVLAVMLVAALWQRWRIAELISTLLVAASVPCLAAGRFTGDVAVASALRWGLAAGFLVCAAAVWQRHRFCSTRFSGWALDRGSTEQPPEGDTTKLSTTKQTLGGIVAQAVLLATTAVPVIALTLIAAALRLVGTDRGGPTAGTLFDQLGPTWSYLVPLALVMAGLVGFAIRERSAGYAFAAGLVLEMIVNLAYALWVKLAGTPIEPVTFLVTLLQLTTITAAAWAIVWLLARRCGAAAGTAAKRWSAASASETLAPRGAAGVTPAPQWLMAVQIGMAVVGNVVLIGWALLTLIFVPLDWQGWSIAAGLPLGWIALVLPLAASHLRLPLAASHLRGKLRPNTIGLFGMAALGLLACTVGGLQPHWNLAVDPAWGYRTLMLGWAVYALMVVLATWWVASLRTLPGAEGPPQALIRMAAVWVRVAGILAVLLGLKAAMLYQEEQLWAATAIAVASAAGATMAVWRRREGWAFAAALGVNLAASLVVWHFELVQRHIFEEYWLRLVQANVIASSAVALVWLAARKRLYELRAMSLRESPLLGMQVALPLAGNFLLLVLPVLWLLHTPGWLPAWMGEFASAAGWAGLLLAAAAAAWYVRQTLPGNLLHVLGALGLGAGVLAACMAGATDPPAVRTAWLAYHVLVATWAALGLVLLAIAMSYRFVVPPLGGPAQQDPLKRALQNPVEQWLAIIGVLTIAFAVLHSFHDPARPWWSTRAVLAVSVTAGLAALWLRRNAYVYVSGLLINLAGVLIWWAWGPGNVPLDRWDTKIVTDLVQTNVVCFAIGSALWSLLTTRVFAGAVGWVEVVGWVERSEPHQNGDREHRETTNGGARCARPTLQRPTLPFAHFAAVAGAALLGLVVIVGVVWDLCGFPHLTIARLDWIALGAIAAATAICLWDRAARFALPTLYCLGLTAVAMATLWQNREDPTPRMFCWIAVAHLAGFALAAAVAGWVLRKLVGGDSRRRLSIDSPTVGDRSRLPQPECLPQSQWFGQLQAVLVIVAAALAAWVSLDFAFDGMGEKLALFSLAGRLAGAPSVLMLLGAAIVMAWQFVVPASAGARFVVPALAGARFVVPALAGGDEGGAAPDNRLKAALQNQALRKRAAWQYAAFALAVLMHVCGQWAMLDSQTSIPWLHRNVAVVVAAAMMALIAGVGLKLVLPWAKDWIARGRAAVPALAGLAGVMVLAAFLQEAVYFHTIGVQSIPPTGVPLAYWEIAVVGLGMIAMAAACIAFALVPAWDPLKQSDRKRQVYVYLAEAILLLVGLHVRFTLPWLFRGYFQQYWMFLVMVLAFAGAGLAEWFHRRRLPVLMQPLERTALVVPLVPALGFWFMPAPVHVWGLSGQVPALWLVMGLFYGVMAVTRRSPLCTVLAIVTANIGLWVGLNQSGIQFLEHPQLWLIPIALAGLVAEYLNRDQLTEAQSTAFRYFALSVVYISSTSEMYVDWAFHLGRDWQLPLVLMALSVAGVLVGILLEIRSFLYLGVSFLVLDLVSMVCHAAVEYPWIWYASGIALGAAIIALFAVFEKRRNDILGAMERMKEWRR